MKISEVMTEEIALAEPDDTLATAARRMAELDVEVLPVVENERLAGTMTGRDIAVRAAAADVAPGEGRVRDFMTADLRFCAAGDDVAEIARKMEAWQVRRLPVVDGERRLVGMISLGDLAAAMAAAADGGGADKSGGIGPDDLMKGGF